MSIVYGREKYDKPTAGYDEIARPSQRKNTGSRHYLPNWLHT